MTLQEANLSFAADPGGAADARRFTRARCSEWGVDDVLDTAILLVSEVVTNAVLHGGSDVDLTLRVEPGQLRVEVRDDNQVLPVRKRYSETAATGRGLVLLEALSSAWGAVPEEVGKVVWFELDLDDGSLLGTKELDDLASADAPRREPAPPPPDAAYEHGAEGGAEATMARAGCL